MEGHVPAVAIGYLFAEMPVGMIGVAVPECRLDHPAWTSKGRSRTSIP